MWLIASDLHLTDNPKDAYRSGILSWLGQEAEQRDVTQIILLGDITDRKDNHSGALINFIVGTIASLARQSRGRWGIHILQGNHDYSNPLNPTFKILNDVELPDVYWYDQPCIQTLVDVGSKHRVLFMPFFRDGSEFTKALNGFAKEDYQVAFFHQTFTGSVTSTGFRLPGIPTSQLYNKAAMIFAGDIHVPQAVGPVEYVGAPYQINFGDKYTGRVLLLNPEEGEFDDLHYPCLRKHTVDITSRADILNNVSLRSGDQIKVRLHLTRDQLEGWHQVKREVEAACTEKGLDLFGIEIKDATAKRVRLGEPKRDARYGKSDASTVYSDFCAENKVSNEIKETGEEFINATS